MLLLVTNPSVSMISFASDDTAQLSDTIPIRNVWLLVGIHLTFIPLQHLQVPCFLFMDSTQNVCPLLSPYRTAILRSFVFTKVQEWDGKPSQPLIYFAMVVTECKLYIPIIGVKRSWDECKCCVIHHGSDVIRDTECQPGMILFRQLNSPWFWKTRQVFASLARYNIKARWLITGCVQWTWRCALMDRQKVWKLLHLLLRPIVQISTTPSLRNHTVVRCSNVTNNQNKFTTTIAYRITWARWL